MKFEITLNNTENVGQFTTTTIKHIEEILSALITSGGLTGVKGGKTVIHFDAEGQFMAVQLDYTPWRRRAK